MTALLRCIQCQPLKKKMKIYNRCKACQKNITGVVRWDGNESYCVKCFRVIEKEKQKIKDEKLKHWYRSDMTDDEYYHAVFDLFC